jgi:hypothetical protein
MNSWQIPGRYDFSIPEAQHLADLSGIDSDLEAVIRICTRCEKLMAQSGKPTEDNGLAWWDDIHAISDLVFASIVRYGRTFSSGVRQGIPLEWITMLPEPLQASHSYFKALRDKYIAHSVNQLEDNQVFVMLTPQFSEHQEPTHITVDRGRFLMPPQGKIKELVILAEALRKMVATEIESESLKLLAIARQLSIEAIKARTTESLPIPGTAETFKVRSKF